MENFNDTERKDKESSSNANDVNLDSTNVGSASLLPPPTLFSNPPIQKKEVNQGESENDEASSATGPYQFSSDGPAPPNDNGNSGAGFSLSSSTAGEGGVMAKMEGAFGADFSNVQINTNSQEASDLGALAYTKGNTIDFAPGQFNPGTSSGQELLGHELTHVVQQREGRVKPTTSVNGKSVNNDASLEKEADAKGAEAAQFKLPSQSTKRDPASSNSGAGAGAVTSQFKLYTHSTTIQRKPKNEDTTPVEVDEVAIAQELINQGAKNENYITDEVFYKRYPGIKRRKLIYPNDTETETRLVRDWIRIRNEVVRPLLRGEDPGKGKPKKGKPKKDKPKKDKPKEKNPKKKPRKDKPKKDKPKEDPEKEPPLEIPEGWDYDDYINVLKAIAEIGRLAPLTVILTPVGLVSGQAAAFLNLVQDLIHSAERKDLVLAILTFNRNATVHVNNFISDCSFISTVVQDYVAMLNAAVVFFTGGTGIVGAGPIAAFGLAWNAVVSGVNAVFDAFVLIQDLLVIWHLKTMEENLPQDDPEKDAYKELLDGYKVNALFDLGSFLLDLFDAGTGGVGHFEVFEKIAKIAAKVGKVVGIGGGSLLTIANVIFGTGAGESVTQGVTQQKADNSEGKSNIDVAMETLGMFVSGNELISEGVDFAGEKWAENMDTIEQTFDDLSNNEEAVLEVHQQILDTISGLEAKIEGINTVLGTTAQVKNAGFGILAQIETAEKAISELEVPEIDLADFEIGDNVVADIIEGVVNAGTEMLEEQFNELMQELNEQIDSFKSMALSATAYAKKQILSVIEQVESFEETVISFQVFLISHLEEVRGILAQTKDPKSLFDAIFNQIKEIYGIDENLSIEDIFTNFRTFKQDAIDLYERVKAEKEKGSKTAQMKESDAPFSLSQHSLFGEDSLYDGNDKVEDSSIGKAFAL